ncbi:hypothetical protein H696_02855 [Fonticula alba]|uniref:Uncharacterized protein n=1 Tax=Fonticula alba TaxID=691883 RepID=A0A058Z8V6_FONAL|nr:hypothetical protein H696_02855 [Fonticula alba]KCV70506.1 hypothetical protein H696_02855 [Fonticula alba]|eukprot:XP_009495022.1 hypothetical protein H696_02855 [Fonticula alba]
MLRLALRAGASGPATRARFSSRAGADVAAPSGRQPLPDVSPASAESSIRAALNGSLKLARRHLFIVSAIQTIHIPWHRPSACSSFANA